MSPIAWNEFSIFAELKRDLVEMIACATNDEVVTKEEVTERAMDILEKVAEYEDALLRDFLQEQANKKQNRLNAATLASTR